MRSILRIRRLQIAGQAPNIAAPRSSLAVPPVPAHNCVAGPSSRPYSSTPISHTQTHLEDQQASYFTSSRPLPPYLPNSSYLQSEDESDKLGLLRNLMNRPSSSRTEYVSRSIFDLYRSLSPFTRQQLPQDLIRKVLRNVVPSAQNLDYGVPGRISRDFRLARAWEERLKMVIGDMVSWRGRASSSSGDGSSFDDRGEYRFALARLARTGRVFAVESIADEMQSRGVVRRSRPEEEVQLHEFRLLAIRNRLTYLSRITRPQKAVSLRNYQKRLDAIFPIFWSVIDALRKDGLVPRQLTCTVIVQIISLFWQVVPTDHAQAEHLEKLFEEILKKGYGLDMEYWTVNKGESKAEIQRFVVRAIVDHLGRKGDVWKMLSAFEVLTQTSQAEADYRSHWNKEDSDEDDVGPTLAQMEAKEVSERSGMSLWQNTPNPDGINANTLIDVQPPAAGDERASHMVPAAHRDYFPSTTASPSAILALPPDHLDGIASGFDPMAQGLTRTDIFSTMLRHACAAQNHPLAHHILRMAVRDTQQLRSAWLARVVCRARMHQAAARDGTATWTGIRNLRNAVLGFDVNWFLSMRPLVLGMYSTAVGEKHLEGGPVTQMFALMEEAQEWLRQERAILDGPLYPVPESDALIEATGQATERDAPPHLNPAKQPIIFLRDIYDLTTHRETTLNMLERIHSLHLESIEQRSTQLARAKRRRLHWYANKVRARQEAESEAVRLAEKKAAARQERKRVVVEEDREEGMMLMAATG